MMKSKLGYKDILQNLEGKYYSIFRYSIQGVKSLWGNRVYFLRLGTRATDRWQINICLCATCQCPRCPILEKTKLMVSIQGVISLWGDRVVFPRLGIGDTDRWSMNLCLCTTCQCPRCPILEKRRNPPKVI